MLKRKVQKKDWDNDALETLKRPILIHKEIIDEITKRVENGGLLLEIGAQRGVDANELVKNGYYVVTLDYSDEAIRMMKKDFGNNLLIVKGDIKYLPFKDNVFDLVYSQGLLEHFFEPELGKILLEQKRIINKNGKVLIDVPNLFSPLTIPKHILMFFRLYVLPQEWQYSWRKLKRIGWKYKLIYDSHYSWGYDRLISRPLIQLFENLPLGLGKIFKILKLYLEKRMGDYFLKCVGVFFTK